MCAVLPLASDTPATVEPWEVALFSENRGSNFQQVIEHFTERLWVSTLRLAIAT